MKGVVFTGDCKLELMNFPDPTPGPDEVVLEMKASGMCGSDLKSYRPAKGAVAASGLPASSDPVIAGHEPCGVVAAVGTAVDARQAIDVDVEQVRILPLLPHNGQTIDKEARTGFGVESATQQGIAHFLEQV